MRIRPIDRLCGDASAFFRTYCEQRPVVMTGMISDWPALRWTPSSLARRYGELEVAAVRYDPSAEETFLEQTLTDAHARLPLRQFLSKLETSDHTYAMREDTTLFERAPTLLDEVMHFAPFVSPTGETPYRSLWIGPPRYVTGLHVDPGDTLLFQLHGRKTVLLFAPTQTPYLYEEPRETRAPKFATSPLQDRLDGAMFRTLRDKVAWARAQPFSPDFTRFPLLAEAECIEAEISLGDTLYIPDRWWHAVRSIDPTISVSVEPNFHSSPFAQIRSTVLP